MVKGKSNNLPWNEKWFEEMSWEIAIVWQPCQFNEFGLLVGNSSSQCCVKGMKDVLLSHDTHYSSRHVQRADLLSWSLYRLMSESLIFSTRRGEYAAYKGEPPCIRSNKTGLVPNAVGRPIDIGFGFYEAMAVVVARFAQSLSTFQQ